MTDPILSDRLLMRPFREDDLGPCHAMWSDPEIGPWVGGTHRELQESVDELQHHLDHQARHGFAFWAVEERDSGLVVGEVGLQRFEGRGPEIETGWCLARETWGKGYAAEAAARWIEVGLGELGFERIVAVVLPHNARSRRVCERLGMREAGLRPAYGADHVQYVSSRTP